MSMFEIFRNYVLRGRLMFDITDFVHFMSRWLYTSSKNYTLYELGSEQIENRIHQMIVRPESYCFSCGNHLVKL
jgi:hypothetical protein